MPFFPYVYCCSFCPVLLFILFFLPSHPYQSVFVFRTFYHHLFCSLSFFLSYTVLFHSFHICPSFHLLCCHLLFLLLFFSLHLCSFFYHHFAFAQFVSLLSLFYLFISLLSLSLPPPFFLSCSFLPSFLFLSFIASFLPLIPLHFVNCHVCCFFHPSLSYFLSFSFCFPLLMSSFSFLITVLLFLPSPLPSISFIFTCPHLHLII